MNIKKLIIFIILSTLIALINGFIGAFFNMKLDLISYYRGVFQVDIDILLFYVIKNWEVINEKD